MFSSNIAVFVSDVLKLESSTYLKGQSRVCFPLNQRKTSIDGAYEIKELLNEDYPEAEKVILVCDNLNTHKVASLYEAFEPKQARQLAERLEIHYTPKHGSWLNMAEIELSVFTKQCLARRIADIETLRKEAKAW